MSSKVWMLYAVFAGLLFFWIAFPKAEALSQALPAAGIKYNFQPNASAVPSGYTSDIGQAYNGTRGWVMQSSLQNPSATPLDMRGYTRDRKVTGVDQRLNTLIALQLTSTALGAWEYNLANGPYTVTASVGDPSYIDSKYRINMEGGIAIHNFIPTSSTKFFSLSHLVYVNDGKLTLDAIGGTNTKLNYVEISNAPAAANRPAVTTTNPKNGATNVSVTSAITADVHIPTAGAGVNQNTLSPSTVKLIRISNNVQVAANLNTSGGGDVIVAQPTAPLAPLTEYFFQVTSGVKDLAGAAFIPYAIRFTTGNATTTIKYNFQPNASAVPSGYTSDIGQAYNGTRGWVMQSSLQNPSATPLDMRGYTRDRKVTGVDQRLNTLIALQLTSTALGAWEYNLANGPYTVTASVGDPSYIDSKYRINMEGGIAIHNFIPTSSTKFFSLSHLVYVNDGKLTLDAIGGTNTKLNYVEISNAPAAANRPAVTTTNPKNGATNVSVTSAITADVHIPTAGAGVNQNTLSPSTVKLIRISNNVQVAANLNTSGGGDVIVAQPTAPLAPLTEYFFQVTSGVKDLAGAAFIPYAIRFTTGNATTTGPSPVKFAKTALPATAGKTFTSVVIGPDQKLYAAVINGEIMRFPINTDGTLGTGQSLQSLRTANSGDRMLIGLAFDPSSTASNLILWISHSAFVFSNGPDWAGKITRLSGTNLGTVRDYVVNLPRSVRDHVTNSLSFGPDGKLYVNQGSNTAMGAPDTAWGNRPERVLNAAILQVNLSAITAPPLNVKSEEGGTYNPFVTNAPVKVYASGIRNAYDHVWHSNGQLYVPTNGSASGGNTPATPSPLPASCTNRIDDVPRGDYTGPQVPGITNVTATQNDYLFRVVQNGGGYYGHPNPKRCEWVMNGGDPTTGTDPAQVAQYPDGTKPDRNWRGFAYDFGLHYSPNGIIEYKNNAFGGALKGKLLVVRYSSGDDIIVLTPDPDTLNIAQSQTGIQGFTGFSSPLDIIENTANGHLYVAEYGGQKITLLRPM